MAARTMLPPAAEDGEKPAVPGRERGNAARKVELTPRTVGIGLVLIQVRVEAELAINASRTLRCGARRHLNSTRAWQNRVLRPIQPWGRPTGHRRWSRNLVGRPSNRQAGNRSACTQSEDAGAWEVGQGLQDARHREDGVRASPVGVGDAQAISGGRQGSRSNSARGVPTMEPPAALFRLLAAPVIPIRRNDRVPAVRQLQAGVDRQVAAVG
jgi:hypothetical protein